MLTENDSSFFFEVIPVIKYPNCLLNEKEQNCFECGLRVLSKCNSPRGACVKPYEGHKRGCPNYGKKPVCPPYAPMFDKVFDLTQPIYLIVAPFDLELHVDRMKSKHPYWSNRQLYNVLYWQSSARKLLKEKIRLFMEQYEEKGYRVVLSPDAMGIDVNATVSQIGLSLQWPVKTVAYKIAMAGIPITSDYMEFLI